jgi:cytochrome c
MAFISMFFILLLGVLFIYAMSRVNEAKDKVGKQLYDENCSSCHGLAGEGLRKLIPPLANSDYIRINKNKLACITKFGLEDSIAVNGVIYNQPMIGNIELEDDEIRDILNYMIDQWYPEFPKFTLNDVKNQLDNCLLNE